MLVAEAVVHTYNLLKTSYFYVLDRGGCRGSLWVLVHCGSLVFERPAKPAALTRKQSPLLPAVSSVPSAKH